MDLTIRDVASIFEVSEGRIYRWIQEDDLPAREVERPVHVDSACVAAAAALRSLSPDT